LIFAAAAATAFVTQRHLLAAEKKSDMQTKNYQMIGFEW
jgi:hypothetical protein